MDKLTTDILIVGGGPAGMASAMAAATAGSSRVTVVDDNPKFGGQIWRTELGHTKPKHVRDMIDAIENLGVGLVSGATVHASDGKSLLAETASGKLRLQYEKLIIATGARERFLPFPGWTLPNVFGAAGLQAMVKGGMDVSGKRIVVAGTGPLLLVVAEYLKSKGARIAAICEQTSNRKLDRFALGLWRTPSKIAQGIGLRSKLRGVPYYRNSWVTAAHGAARLNRVAVNRFGKPAEIECDMLAVGFHLVPNTELAQLLGCEIADGFVTVDEYQQTSVDDIYCAGEPTAIGGVEASIVEGKIAGFAAVGDLERAERLFAARKQTDAFANALDQAFELRDELKSLAASSTIVCRCEDVQYGKLKEYKNFRSAKLQTRCGMGACQGRVCGSAVEFLFGWDDRSVRPPIFPVRMENL